MSVSLVIIWSLSVLLLIGGVLLYALVKYVIPRRRARRRPGKRHRANDHRRGPHITTYRGHAGSCAGPPSAASRAARRSSTIVR